MSKILKRVPIAYRLSVNITKENSLERYTRVPESPPKMTPLTRFKLIEKLYLQMGVLDWNFHRLQDHAAFGKEQSAFFDMQHGLEKLMKQDGAGVRSALNLYAEFAPKTGLLNPENVFGFDGFSVKASQLSMKPKTGIQWGFLPKLDRLQHKLKEGINSGKPFFAIRQEYSHHLKTGLTTFADLKQATQYAYSRKLNGDLLVIHKAEVALTEIHNTLLKLDMIKSQKTHIRKNTGKRI